MAPSTGKPVKLLVANKKVMEAEKTWNKLEYPRFSGTDGVYFVDDEDVYGDVLHSMAVICKKPVTRIYYTDSDNDEVPIDSEVEFKEALKFIGQRTNKGKFTTMKIEMENDLKTSKKKVKKTKGKVIPKVGESTVSKKSIKGMSKKTKTDSTPNIDPLHDEAFANASTSDISKAWLEKHFQELKTDIMAELKILLEPYIAEQKRMSSVIASLQTMQVEKISPVQLNMKQQTESDHNYSASSNSRIVKSSNKSEYDSVDDTPEQEVEAPSSDSEQECEYIKTKCQGADFNSPVDDDENLSICSGEISVTDSESEPDEVTEDFIDVPLPSCFNVIAPQGAASNKLEKKNRTGKILGCDTSKKLERARVNPEEIKENKKKCALKESAKKIGTKQVFKEQTTYSNFSGSNWKTNINQNLREENSSDLSIEDDICRDTDKNYVDNANEVGQKFDDYDDYEEVNGEKNHPLPSFPISSQVNVNKPARHVSGLNTNVQLKDTLHQGQKYASSHGQSLASSQYMTQYNAPVLSYETPRLAPFCGQQYPAQTPQGFVNSSKNVQPSTSVQNQFGQERQQIRRAVQQPYQQQQLQPTSSQQPLSSKCHPTAATIIAQHQQIVQAARRAAYQAQQTQALCFNPQTSLTDQQGTGIHTTAQEVKSLFQETQPHDEKVSLGSQTSQTVMSQGETTTSCNIPKKTETMHRLMEEAAHELKLWNEVDQVDLELHKWIKMCQDVMEHPLKEREDGEKYKKFSPAAAAKTYEDLERVYQKFRKEVQLVSTQIDAQKQQKQQLQASGQTLADDPIAILPEKLMQIISSTLNTTFNLLGHISKLGVMNPPSSGPSGESKAAPTPISTSGSASFSSSPSATEKPQPQMSAVISPQMSGIGNLPAGYSGLPMYYCPVQTLSTDQAAQFPGILSEVVGNQEPNITYRVRTVGSYPLPWGQTVSTFTTTPALNQTQNTMQVIQPQNQLQQPQALLHSQYQFRQPAIRQTQSQSQLQQQIHLQQFQPSTQMQPLAQRQVQPQPHQSARKEGGRLESAYTLQMHDTPMAQDANGTTIPLLYTSVKPNTPGFHPKAFGPSVYREY